MDWTRDLFYIRKTGATRRQTSSSSTTTRCKNEKKKRDAEVMCRPPLSLYFCDKTSKREKHMHTSINRNEGYKDVHKEKKKGKGNKNLMENFKQTSFFWSFDRLHAKQIYNKEPVISRTPYIWFVLLPAFARVRRWWNTSLLSSSSLLPSRWLVGNKITRFFFYTPRLSMNISYWVGSL